MFFKNKFRYVLLFVFLFASCSEDSTEDSTEELDGYETEDECINVNGPCKYVSSRKQWVQIVEVKCSTSDDCNSAANERCSNSGKCEVRPLTCSDTQVRHSDSYECDCESSSRISCRGVDARCAPLVEEAVKNHTTEEGYGLMDPFCECLLAGDVTVEESMFAGSPFCSCYISADGKLSTSCNYPE